MHPAGPLPPLLHVRAAARQPHRRPPAPAPRPPSPRPGIPGGRRQFHGERELYRSNHRDVIHSQTILGRCLVHTLDAYRVRRRAGQPGTPAAGARRSGRRAPRCCPPGRRAGVA